MAKKKSSPAAIGPDAARKIWLAGIGAYGRAFSEAQESLAKVSGGTSRMFEDLVAKGEEIEDAVETRGKELAKQVKASSFSIDDRIKQMRARLHLGEEGGERLAAVEARLAAIEKKLDALLAQQGKAQAKKPAKKKAAKKRAS